MHSDSTTLTVVGWLKQHVASLKLTSENNSAEAYQGVTGVSLNEPHHMLLEVQDWKFV